jgi:hypothetical protein
MKTLIVLFSLLTLSFSSFAEDHSLGNFTGTDIELKAYDHSFAGAIRDFTAFGWVDEATFTSHLTIRKYAKTTVATFKKDEKGAIGGTISTEESRVEVAFVGYDKEQQILLFKLNGEDISIKITSDGIVNGHFQNPTYSTVINGKNYSYHLEGEACVGLSLHYNMMILAALLF